MQSAAVPSRFPGSVGRRALLAAAATPLLPRFAKAAEFTWRLGHSAPADFPLHIRLIEASGIIAARTDGRLKVAVYGNSELGSPVGLFSQVRAGTIEAAPLSADLLGSNLAGASLPMMGFAFSGYDNVWAAMDGDVGKLMRGQLLERLGLVVVGRPSNFGFRQITTNGKVVRTAADLEGLHLRTPPEADFVGLFQALKALPVAMPLNALLSALSSHAVDGQEGVLPLVKAANLDRVQSVCSLTNHIWDGQWLCVSKKAWGALPDKLKEIVIAAFDETALRQREDTSKNEAAVRASLEAAGMKFNTVEPESFRKVLRAAGYYSAWKKKVGEDAMATLEKYTGRLA